jgi:putative ABC transport system permease protein
MAIFILLIACINFMNLTTARSSTLAKEVGVRKAIGAARVHLIRQFLGESIMLTLVGLSVGICLMALFLPTFNHLARQNFTFLSLFEGSMIWSIVATVLFTGFLAGSYPAFYLSRFQTATVMRGVLPKEMRGSGFRKVLVITQFSLAILLMLSTLMVYKQVRYLRNMDVGFNKENVVYFGIGDKFRKNIDTIRTEFLANPRILNVTLTDIAPYRWQSNAGYGDVHWQGKTNQQVKMVMVAVDTHYLDTFGLKMAKGRYFSDKFKTDASEAFVVNEAAVRAMEMDNPIGKELKIWSLRGKIIGVVKDYHFESLHRKIIPMAMRIDPQGYGQACVRISPSHIAETIQFLKGKWQKIYPEYPFEFRFLDERIHNLYRVEEAIGRLVKTFTILAIFISCLGLFGLASFTVEKRTKEIGIRKVCGASICGLIFHLSKDFLKLVVLSCIIATPVTLYLVHQWLVEFAYRTSLNIANIFFISLLALAIAFLTIGYNTFRSARINPTEALRYE